MNLFKSSYSFGMEWMEQIEYIHISSLYIAREIRETIVYSYFTRSRWYAQVIHLFTYLGRYIYVDMRSINNHSRAIGVSFKLRIRIFKHRTLPEYYKIPKGRHRLPLMSDTSPDIHMSQRDSQPNSEHNRPSIYLSIYNITIPSWPQDKPSDSSVAVSKHNHPY